MFEYITSQNNNNKKKLRPFLTIILFGNMANIVMQFILLKDKLYCQCFCMGKNAVLNEYKQ